MIRASSTSSSSASNHNSPYATGRSSSTSRRAVTSVSCCHAATVSAAMGKSPRPHHIATSAAESGQVATVVACAVLKGSRSMM
ncbi:hypothetical protein ACRJ4B_05060 [Streptomyces sp. GTA36]